MQTASRLALLGSALAFAGCGERAAAAPLTAAKPVGDANTGSVVQVADCEDWNAGTREEQEATVVALRRQLTPTHSKDAASPLPDGKAFEILEKSCSVDYGASLRLYKLYARAQGFAPLSQ